MPEPDPVGPTAELIASSARGREGPAYVEPVVERP